MKFMFNINVTDDDYFDYNKFMMLRSPYGKKQITTFRITLCVLVFVFAFLFLLKGGFTLNSFIGAIPFLILLIVLQVFLTRFMTFSIKSHIAKLKKNGKMAYSPTSVIEFYEDSFVEIAPDNKIEQKYSAVERISVVGEMIYIHVNNVMSYMLPLSSFESEQQKNSFFEFIKTKCSSIDFY